MKKLIIFLVFVIAFCGMFWYIYSQNKITKNAQIANNQYYESLQQKDIKGSELATIINKTMDQNSINNIKKDNSGIYIDDNEKSILISIKFKDNNNNINAQKIVIDSVSKFVQIYGNYTFKCTSLEHHKNGNIKNLHFEEV